MRKTTADQHPRVALCVSRILLEKKKRFPEVICVHVEYSRSKNQTLQKSEHRWSNSLRNTPPPKSSRTPQEEPHFVAQSTGATSCRNGTPERSSCGLFPPRWSKLLCGKSSSLRKSGLKRTLTDVILKKFY
jgi:hypothetical protein